MWGRCYNIRIPGSSTSQYPKLSALSAIPGLWDALRPSFFRCLIIVDILGFRLFLCVCVCVCVCGCVFVCVFVGMYYSMHYAMI